MINPFKKHEVRKPQLKKPTKKYPNEKWHLKQTTLIDEPEGQSWKNVIDEFKEKMFDESKVCRGCPIFLRFW